MEKNKKKNVYVCIPESRWCRAETQHCKSTILQLEKESFHLMLMMLKWMRKENQS